MNGSVWILKAPQQCPGIAGQLLLVLHWRINNRCQSTGKRLLCRIHLYIKYTYIHIYIGWVLRATTTSNYATSLTGAACQLLLCRYGGLISTAVFWKWSSSVSFSNGRAIQFYCKEDSIIVSMRPIIAKWPTDQYACMHVSACVYGWWAP